MEELEIIVEQELEFVMKKCGQVVPVSDVTKAYVDQQDALKVDKVAGKSLVADEEIAALWHRFAGSCLIPEITDNGNGTVTLGEGSFCTYKNTLGQGMIEKHLYDGSIFSITNGSMNYIVGDYNNGSPTVRVTTDVTEINEITVVPIYSIFRSGLILHIQHWDSLAAALANKIHKSIIKTQRYRRQEGLVVSSFGTRNLLLSSGIVYVGAVEYILPEVNSTTDGILQFTQNNLGVWVINIVSQFNNTQYNTPTGVVELTNNRYAVNWIFRGVENPKHMYSVLGVGDYTLQQAQEAAVPSIPINISSHGMLVAKIIIQKNSNTPISIRSAFDTSISFSAITEHNNTTGIQGGIAGEYYHLTAAQISKLNTSIIEIPAAVGASTYTLTNNKQVLITGVLPNGVNSTIALPALVAGDVNECILHFTTNAVAAPTLVYSGFTPVWLNGAALAMKVNKQYTIIFERINGIVKTSWGEY